MFQCGPRSPFEACRYECFNVDVDLGVLLKNVGTNVSTLMSTSESF